MSIPEREEKEEIMFGRINSLVLFLLVTGCLETKEGLDFESSGETQEAETCWCGTGQQDAHFGPVSEPVSEPVVESIAKDGIELTPMDRDLEWQCAMFSRPVRFLVQEDDPAIFLLQPVSTLRYCVEVNRLSGYLTLSHKEGEVRREQDLFTWCVTRDIGAMSGPMRLEVQALTPEASFEISLKRGGE